MSSYYALRSLSSTNDLEAEYTDIIEQTIYSHEATMNAPKHDFIQARDTCSRQWQDIRLLIIHATAGKNSLNWLLGNERGTSIHILIDKQGKTKRLVRDDRGANHAGYSEVTLDGVHYGRAHNVINVNAISLGIELENLNDGKDPYPDIQLEECARWIIYWRSLYPKLHLRFHREIDTQGKSDPKGITHEQLQAFIDKVTGTKTKAPCQAEDTSWKGFDPTLEGILTDKANIRQGPGRQFPVAGVYPKGTLAAFDGVKQGEKIGENSRWLLLSNRLGFIHNSLVKLPKE
jgi:hypothetical protein